MSTIGSPWYVSGLGANGADVLVQLLDPVYNGPRNITATTFSTAYNTPDVVNPNLVGKNKDINWIAGDPRVSADNYANFTPDKGPQVLTTYPTTLTFGKGVTTENWLTKAQNEIGYQESEVWCGSLPLYAQVEIIDSYRRLAGLKPLEVGYSASSLNALLQGNIHEVVNPSITATVGKIAESASSAAKAVVGPVTDTIKIAAVAAAILAAVFLLK